MFFRRPTAPSPPASPSAPEREGDTLIFRSRDHLDVWVRSLDTQPQALRVVTPRHLGDLSTTFQTVARARHGGAVLVLTPPGSQARAWLEEARLEHGPDGLSAPWPVRVAGEDGFLVGVIPTEPPTTWERLEPDDWPVPAAADTIFDAQRVEVFMRSPPFARPVGVSESDHEAATLLRFGARRWFRGALVPTLAGLVVFGQHADRHLPGCAIAIRWPGRSEQHHQGALPWVVRRVSEERSLWGTVPQEVARALIVLSLAERAWAGPDARTPITLSVEPGWLRLAIPTAPANAREQEDRAPGNPRLRLLLVRAGLLPVVPGREIPDNEELLGQLDGRYPGIQCRFEDHATWLDVPLRPGAPVARGLARVASPTAATAHVTPAELAPQETNSAASSPSVPLATTIAAPLTTPSAMAAVPATVAPPSTPPASRPAARRAPPIFHPRPAAPAMAAAASLQPAAPAAPIPHSVPPVVAQVTASPSVSSPPTPAVAPLAQPQPTLIVATPVLAPPAPRPSTGPLTLDERKAQLRDLFRQADRPLALRELAETVGVHRDTLNPALKALIAEGWLEPTEPNSRSPVQRYRCVSD